MLLGFLTPVVELIVYPFRKGMDGIVRVISSTADGVKTAIGDGYSFSTDQIGKILRKSWDRIVLLADETATGAKRLANATIEKTGEAINATRDNTKSLAKYSWEKWAQWVDLLGTGLKRWAELTGSALGKAGELAKGAGQYIRRDSAGNAVDYEPEFRRNPIDQIGEMVRDISTETAEVIDGTRNRLVNTFNFVYGEWEQTAATMTAKPGGKKMQYAAAA